MNNHPCSHCFGRVNTVKYSSSSSNLLLFRCFGGFSHPLSREAPCPTYTLDGAAGVSGAALKWEAGSFGDEERGHMFGLADKGEEWNTGTLRAQPTSGDHGETSKFTKCIRAYSYPLLKTRGGARSRILLVSSPRPHL